MYVCYGTHTNEQYIPHSSLLQVYVQSANICLMCVHVCVHVWRQEDNFQNLLLSFHTWVPEILLKSSGLARSVCILGVISLLPKILKEYALWVFKYSNEDFQYSRKQISSID